MVEAIGKTIAPEVGRPLVNINANLFHMESMMKSAILLGLALLCTANVANSYDLTKIVAGIPPHSVRRMEVAVPQGESLIEVWGTQKENISCTFMGSQGDIQERLHTDRCSLTTVAKTSDSLTLYLNNETETEIDVRVWIHDTK